MKKLAYTKFQGLGNDFIIFDKTTVEGLDWPALARAVCDRRFGIGADGMVVLSPGNDVRMDFYNSDGSIAPMCGNASRCVAYYVQERGLITADNFILNTLGGDVHIARVAPDLVRVNLGRPSFAVAQIPALYPKSEILREKVQVAGQSIELSAVFMTTSHCVIFVPEIKEKEVQQLGPLVENMAMFPIKINVNFARIVDTQHIELVTWERGAGRTLACGTGACATVAVANRLGLIKGSSKVQMDGGSLYIEIVDDAVLMTGSAQKIADGNYYYPGL